MRFIPISIILVLNIFLSDIFALDITTSDICKYKKCIKKCCRENYHVKYKTHKCESNNGSSIDIRLPVYDISFSKTSIEFEDIFHLDTLNPAYQNKEFRKYAFEARRFDFNIFLTESGILYLEYPNAYKRWLPQTADRYCLDYHNEVQEDNSTISVVSAWVVFTNDDDQGYQGNNYLTTGMIISCVFLVLVLVVYSILPQLRNLGGQILMAYTFSLLCAFIFLMVVQRGRHSNEACVGLTLSVYFWFLASFCWMNTMSYDIWWTFRGYAKARPIHRRGEKFKFCMYCLYSFGVPGAMTIGLAILNFSDMRHLPWFVKPSIPTKGCFLEGGEKLLYFYVPMLIMIVMNWMFYLMTAFNIWRLSRGTTVLDSAAAGNPASHRMQRHRLLVYLKLSVLMGLNWILEVVSSFKPQWKVWYISDTFNLLIGLSIFIIFVCKKNILKSLDKRLFPKRRGTQYGLARSRSSSVTETSNISQDLTAVQINPNPKHKPIF